MSDILKLQIGSKNYLLDIEKATQTGALKEEIRYNIGSYFRYDGDLPSSYGKFFILYRDQNTKCCSLVNLRSGRQFSAGVETESYYYVNNPEWEKITVKSDYTDKLTLVTHKEAFQGSL